MSYRDDIDTAIEFAYMTNPPKSPEEAATLMAVFVENLVAVYLSTRQCFSGNPFPRSGIDPLTISVSKHLCDEADRIESITN